MRIITLRYILKYPLKYLCSGLRNGEILAVYGVEISFVCKK